LSIFSPVGAKSGSTPQLSKIGATSLIQSPVYIIYPFNPDAKRTLSPFFWNSRI